jgi:hypothetical protein
MQAQIGRVLGKALYEGILVDVSFAGFFRECTPVTPWIELSEVSGQMAGTAVIPRRPELTRQGAV